MKLMTGIITAIIAFFATTSFAGSEGGFMEPCKIVSLEEKFYKPCGECPRRAFYKVWANCTAADDKFYNNELNLDLCLVNDHGKMQWRKRGGFDKSCEKCSLGKAEEKKVEMTCHCNDGINEKLRMNTIDLNKYIRLEGNTIWCGDEIGIAHA